MEKERKLWKQRGQHDTISWACSWWWKVISSLWGSAWKSKTNKKEYTKKELSPRYKKKKIIRERKYFLFCFCSCYPAFDSVVHFFPIFPWFNATVNIYFLIQLFIHSEVVLPYGTMITWGGARLGMVEDRPSYGALRVTECRSGEPRPTRACGAVEPRDKVASFPSCEWVSRYISRKNSYFRPYFRLRVSRLKTTSKRLPIRKRQSKQCCARSLK